VNRIAALVLATLALGAAQAPPDAIRVEREEFARWLETAPSSPFRAMAQVPIGPGIAFGPASADVPLTGVGPARIEERGGRLTLTAGGTARPVARDRLLSLGSFRLLPAGLPGRSVVTVFGPDARGYHPPTHYPYSPAWRFQVTLAPAAGRSERLLAPDGTEVEATEAGTVTVSVGGRPTPLRVFRIGTPGTEESELEIFFQDGSNGSGSYPAGRFVNLVPGPDGRYVMDLNRARNPFCAYNTVFPCPAPWRGNRLPLPVEAGERYAGESPAKPPR
jgi:hypothetical protein